MLELGVFCFVDGAVNGKGLAALYMPLGSVEMGIARNNIPLLHQSAEKHIFGSTPLVGRNHYGETCDSFNRILHIEKRSRTGIAFIAGHHSRPLAVAHGTRARIGQQVDINLLGRELENIVMGRLNPLLTLLSGALTDRLNHLYTPRFGKR